ncbi:membrane protein [Streptomyces chromofuscus]|nr:membrane protein [Streptomyces chromofuscus]
MQYDDPWYDATASGWSEPTVPAAPVPPARDEVPAAGDVYLEVHRGAAFQEVRSRYLRFVVPAVTGFFVWYVAYVVAATVAPGVMARPVVGAVNVAMLAGLGQFLTTFLLTWAYARHARLRRDRAALELRWDTQELTRGLRGGAS